MKKILFLFAFCLMFTNSNTQNTLGKSDDLQRIAIKPYYSKSKINSKEGNVLLTKMNKLISEEGLSSTHSRYIMWPRIDELSSEATTGASVMYVTELDVSFYIADNVTQTVYSSTSFTVKGVDRKRDKSRFKAIKKVKLTNDQGTEFLTEAKNRVIEFYNSKCDFILKEAQSKALRKEYDAAIFELTSIPEICKDCFMRGQNLAIQVFQDKMENECMTLVANAKAAKAKDNYELAATYLASILPDVSCYTDAQKLLKEIEDHRCAISLGKAKGAWSNMNAVGAAKYLSEISTDSNCAKDAESLNNEIRKKLKEDADKEWALAYEKYNREQVMKEKNQEHGMDMDHRNMDYKENQGFELEKRSIDAARAIGVAFGENQPPPAEINWIDNRY